MPNPEIYIEDPAKFVEECYDEWKEHYDRNISKSNKIGSDYFRNYSDELEKRKKNKWLKTSALFVPMIQPHMLSRVSQFIGISLANDPPVKWQPLPGTPVENAQTIQELVLLRFFGDKMENTAQLSQLFISAEISRMAIVKVGLDKGSHDEMVLEPEVLDLSTPLPMEAQSALPPPQEGLPLNMVRKIKKVGGDFHPVWDLLPPESFFYDSYPWKKKNWLYCGDVKYVTESYLREHERAGDYTGITEAIKETEGKASDSEETEMNRQAAGKLPTLEVPKFSYEEMSKDQGISSLIKRGEHRHLLKECWAVVPKLPEGIPEESKADLKELVKHWEGETEIKVITTVNGKIVADRPKPDAFMQIDFPYVIFVSNSLPCQIEGLSSAEIEAPLQKMLNQLWNDRVDAGRYMLFTPMQIDDRCKIIGDMIWSPNAILKVDGLKEYGGIQPINNQTHMSGIIQQFVAEQRLIEEKAENSVAATDLILGSRNLQTDRTLGETQMRHQGTVNRLNLTLVNYAAGILEICDMFEKIYQATIPLDKGLKVFSGKWQEDGSPIENEITYDMIRGRFKKTMPHIAGYVDKNSERILWTMLYDRLVGDPLFGTPDAHYKLLHKFLEIQGVQGIDDLMPKPQMLPPEMIIQMMMGLFGGNGGGQGPTMNPTVKVPPGGGGRLAVGVNQQ